MISYNNFKVLVRTKMISDGEKFSISQKMAIKKYFLLFKKLDILQKVADASNSFRINADFLIEERIGVELVCELGNAKSPEEIETVIAKMRKETEIFRKRLNKIKLNGQYKCTYDASQVRERLSGYLDEEKVEEYAEYHPKNQEELERTNSLKLEYGRVKAKSIGTYYKRY